MFGEDTPEAKEWFEYHRAYLKTHGGSKLLKEIENYDPDTFESRKKDIQREINYIKNHAEHINFKESREAGIPIGSGAMESFCAQLQHCFKGIGKSWSRNHLSKFLEVYVWHMNGELKYAMG